MTGDLEYTKVTVVVDDHSVQTGKIAFQKSSGKTRVIISFTKPTEKYVLFEGNKVSLYQPKIAEVDEYPLAKRQDLLEQFLLLGFGTQGSEMKKSYQISLRGMEDIGGRQALLLDLTPKSENVSTHLQKMQLWLSPDTWEPIQQKFYEPGGDYLIARYSNVKINPKISDKSFRLPIKGKVKVVRPQG
jgi:outer membrane lipoprotein-sorting protein